VDKSAQAFRTISEAAEQLQVAPHVLRFWESKFKQIRPVKRDNGRRLFRPEDIVLIRNIKYLLYERGMTIRGVQKFLQENGVEIIRSPDFITSGQMPNESAGARGGASAGTGTAHIDTQDRKSLESARAMLVKARQFLPQ